MAPSRRALEQHIGIVYRMSFLLVGKQQGTAKALTLEQSLKYQPLQDRWINTET